MSATSQRASSNVLTHHWTHRQLLHEIPAAEVLPSAVDAIIVPSVRPAPYLKATMLLAKGLGCGVVALCSGRATASDAAALGDEKHVSVIAIDVADDTYDLPEQRTDALAADSPSPYPYDTSKKRNLGLLLSHVAGWERIVFVDDDVVELGPSDARAAAGLVDDGYAVVGMNNAGHPDNSVVCYANRILDGRQAQFLGAGAMATSPRTRAFFPRIYNDDWFYMLGTGVPPSAAIAGSMRQLQYDPFEYPERAQAEEFGDCLAEGLYRLVDNRSSLDRADCEYWDGFLAGRVDFIENLLRQLSMSKLERDYRGRVETALAVARETCTKISSQMCVEYVAAWRADLASWQRFLSGQPVKGSLGQALRHLKWPTSDVKFPWPADGISSRQLTTKIIFHNGECAGAGDDAIGVSGGPSASPQVASAVAVG